MPCHSHANAVMVKKKETSIDLRQKIVDVHKAGNSYSKISKQLEFLGSKVQSVIKKSAQFGTAETLPGCDRKQKLAARIAQKLFREVNNIPRMMLDVRRSWH